MSTGRFRGFRKLAAAVAVLSGIAVTVPQIALTGVAGGAALVGASMLSSVPAKAQPNKRICGKRYRGGPYVASFFMEVNKADLISCSGIVALFDLQYFFSKQELIGVLISETTYHISGSTWFLRTCEYVTSETGGGYGGDVCNSMVDYTRYVFVTGRG